MIPPPVPDLSPEGIRRVTAALAAEGVRVFWDDETDHATFVDLHLRPVGAEVPLTLSWRGTTGWVLTLHTKPVCTWTVDAADLAGVADQVASITEDL